MDLLNANKKLVRVDLSAVFIISEFEDFLSHIINFLIIIWELINKSINHSATDSSIKHN